MSNPLHVVKDSVVRARDRARARTRMGSHGDYTIDVLFTAALLLIAVVIGNSDKLNADATVPIEILLAIFEVVFLSFRAVIRRLDRLA